MGWELTRIKLPVNEVKSNLVRRSAEVISEQDGDFYVIYAVKERNTKGWLRKDDWQTRSAGRFICDLMQEELGNDGFFTFDEIAYHRGEPTLHGLTRDQIGQIAKDASADPEKDQVYVFVYNEKMARAASVWLERKLDSYMGFRRFVGPFAA